MGQNVATDALICKGAYRGSAGNEEVLAVRRYQFRPNLVGTKVLRGKKMDKLAKPTYIEVFIAIETTNVSEYHHHLTHTDEEILICSLEDFDKSFTRTHHRVVAEGGGPSEFPPPEQGGDAPRHELLFRLLEKGDGEGLDTAFDDV
jgi:hypothetical protein